MRISNVCDLHRLPWEGSELSKKEKSWFVINVSLQVWTGNSHTYAICRELQRVGHDWATELTEAHHTPPENMRFWAAIKRTNGTLSVLFRFSIFKCLWEIVIIFYKIWEDGCSSYLVSISVTYIANLEYLKFYF